MRVDDCRWLLDCYYVWVRRGGGGGGGGGGGVGGNEEWREWRVVCAINCYGGVIGHEGDEVCEYLRQIEAPWGVCRVFPKPGNAVIDSIFIAKFDVGHVVRGYCISWC